MQATIVRWAFTLASLFVAGPIARVAVRGVEAGDGGQSLVMLGGGASGIVAAVVTFALAAAMGLGAARFVHARHGFFCAGLVFAWAGFASGDFLGWVQRMRDDAGFMQLLPDAVVFTLIGAALAWAIVRLAPDERSGDDEQVSAKGPEPLASMTTLTAVIVAGVGGFLAASLVAQSPNVGQAFAAAAFGGLAGGVAGRASAYLARTEAYLWGVLVLGVITPIAAHIATGSLVTEAFDHDLIALAWVTPWMWLAGAFVGTPFGIAWADSMVKQSGPAAVSQPAPSAGARIKRASE